MAVTPCSLPTDTAIDRELIQNAFFADSYRVPLHRSDATVVDIFFAAFGHHPAWLKAALLARHRIGALFGLRAARASQILSPAKAASYQVGQPIGPWPLHFLSDSELIAGVNDKHLDFRVSVQRPAAVTPRSQPSPLFAALTIGSVGCIFASSHRSIAGAFNTSCPGPAKLGGCDSSSGLLRAVPAT
jgi:hypothetical protein